eukprot:5228-Eustigmatos_ZCMA.PRE.1
MESNRDPAQPCVHAHRIASGANACRHNDASCRTDGMACLRPKRCLEGRLGRPLPGPRLYAPRSRLQC